MTNLESKSVIIPQKPQEIFQFLSDFNNFGALMPEQVEDFKTDGETCSFAIKGMAKLGLAFESKTPSNEIIMKSDGKVPFDFKLRCRISEAGEQSQLQLFLDADLNPFLKMMAEKPLTNFLNLLVERYPVKGVV